MALYSKRVCLLAASRKHQGLCFAGLDNAGKWIRPISDREDEEISDAEAKLPGGGRARVGDIVEITFLRPAPADYQVENHLIDPSKRWRKVGVAKPATIADAVSPEGTLWLPGSSSGGYLNNRMTEATAKRQQSSLQLIRPSTLVISIARKGGDYADANKRQVKAHFSHGGTDYILGVTDPAVEARMTRSADRKVKMDGAILCVSLGEVYRGHAYKLVASVIEPK